MTQNFLEAAKKYFQSSNVVEVTIEMAKEFALTANNSTVNSQTHLSSVTSDVQSLNIKRADPRVTHEWFTLKLNSSKPQQPGSFVIEHQTEKSAILRRRIVIPYADVLGLQVDKTKIIPGFEIIFQLAPVKLSGQAYFCSDTTHFRPDINSHYVISL